MVDIILCEFFLFVLFERENQAQIDTVSGCSFCVKRRSECFCILVLVGSGAVGFLHIGKIDRAIRNCRKLGVRIADLRFNRNALRKAIPINRFYKQADLIVGIPHQLQTFDVRKRKGFFYWVRSRSSFPVAHRCR